MEIDGPEVVAETFSEKETNGGKIGGEQKIAETCGAHEEVHRRLLLVFPQVSAILKKVQIDKIRACLSRLKFTSHAIKEMLAEEFGEITEDEVRQALESGEVIENYPKDRPVPSGLVYGKTIAGRNLHVVCAPIMEEKILVIVTVYEPDPAKWIGFRRRTP